MRRGFHFLFVSALCIACAWVSSARAGEGVAYAVSQYCAGQVFSSPAEAAACIIAKLKQNDALHPVPWKFPLVDGNCATPTVAGAAQCSGHRNALCDAPWTGSYDGTTCGPFPPYVDNGIWTATITLITVTCNANDVVSNGYFDIGTNSAASPLIIQCRAGCESVFDGTSPAGSALTGGVKHFYARGSYIKTGNQCSAPNSAGDPLGGVPPDSCGPGQVMGTVNGKPRCATTGPAGTPTTAPNGSPTTSGPPGTAPTSPTTSTGSTSTSSNPDGSTTTTTTNTTNYSGGGSSTTTTVTNNYPDGHSTSTTTTTGSGPGSSSGVTPGSSNGEEGDPGEENPCTSNPASEGCGGNPTAPGSIRTPGTRTVSDAIGDARNAFLASGVGLAVGNFFTLSVAGSCPSWAWSIPWLNAHVDFNVFCASFAIAAFGVMKAVLLCVGAWFAFRTAME